MTHAQKKVLDAISAFVAVHGYSPTLRQIANAVGLKSISTVHKHTRRLIGGESVLDTYMGTGTTLVAAKNLGRTSIGIEIEERYCEIAAKRLSQGVLEFTEEAVSA